MSNNGTEPRDPVAAPTIAIGGREYPLKMSMLSLMAIEDMGYTAQSFMAEVGRWFPKKDESTGEVVPGRVRASEVIRFIKACLPPAVNVSVEELASSFGPYEFPALIRVALEVLSKTPPPAQPIKLQEPAAEAEMPKPN